MRQKYSYAAVGGEGREFPQPPMQEEEGPYPLAGSSYEDPLEIRWTQSTILCACRTFSKAQMFFS